MRKAAKTVVVRRWHNRNFSRATEAKFAPKDVDLEAKLVKMKVPGQLRKTKEMPWCVPVFWQYWRRFSGLNRSLRWQHLLANAMLLPVPDPAVSIAQAQVQEVQFFWLNTISVKQYAAPSLGSYVK